MSKTHLGTYILCDQVGAIDMKRPKERIGFINKDMAGRLNETIKAILSL